MIKEFLLKHKFIVILFFLALLLRFPWLYTTIEKDEGQFGYVSWRWVSGDGLYANSKDNKPILLYVFYSIPIFFFGNSIIPIRVLNNILFLASLVFFFKLVEHLFNKRIAFFSALFYIVFMNVPVFEGYFAMSESLLTPFLIMSVYFFERYTTTRKTYLIFLSSTLASISLLIKQQSVFILFILISGIFIYKERDKIKKSAFIIFVPFVSMFIIFLLNNQFFECLLQRTWAGLIQTSMGFSSGYQPFEYNLLIVLGGSVLFLFFIIGIVKVFKFVRKEREWFLISWLFFASIFTLVPPAYGHYYIFLIPPLAIFAGIGLNYAAATKQNKVALVLLTALLLLITVLLVTSQFPDSNLKTEYLKWGVSSLESYSQQIKISDFIKNNTYPADKILVLGWEPVLYWLSERLPPRGINPTSNANLLKRSILNNILKKEGGVRLIISLDKTEGFEGYSDLLFADSIVHGISVYTPTMDKDRCYLNVMYKKRDKSICEFISSRPFKDYCWALLSLDFNYCDKITNPLMRDDCLTIIAAEKKDTSICSNIKDYNLSNNCVSVLKGGYNHTACINSLIPKYGDRNADYRCIRYYSILNKDTAYCDLINLSDVALFCKERVTSDKSYCENISDVYLYNRCMIDATSDISSCRLPLLGIENKDFVL